MTQTYLNNIALFVGANWATILGFIGVAWAYLQHIAPLLKDKHVTTVVSTIVNALQQTVTAPGQRFAGADAALAKEFPRMTPAERKVIIEAEVALNKVASGAATFDQLPPVAPATALVDYQALATQALADAAPEIEAMIEAKIAAAKAEPHTTSGQFTSAPVVVSSPAPATGSTPTGA